ncbi:MAG: DUF4012 domain-containing protein [Candidatus Woesebacteria bacterium]|nr:DUF4012 domain-containing protein [Candidatus Woesebacteria bacterium]
MRPTVFLFSESDAFSLYVLENLLSNLCRVIVFSNDVKVWEKFTSHITKTNYLIFESVKNCKKYPKPDYFLMVDFLDVSLFNTLNSKGFVIISGNNLQGVGIELPETVGVIIIDNLFGPRMGIDERNRISQVIGVVIKKGKIKIFEGERISLVYMGDAAKLIVKWLFSFGPYGEVVSISSNKQNLADICQMAKGIFPDFKYQVVNEHVNNLAFGKNKTYLLDKDNSKPLEETFLWFKKNIPPKVVIKRVRMGTPRIVKVLIFLSVTLATPFAFILIAISLLFVSGKMAISESFNSAKFFVNASYIVSNIANKESGVLTNVPILGKLYVPASSFSFMLKDLSMVGLRGFDLTREIYSLSDNILGEGKYNLKEAQEEIISNLDYIDTTLSFIEGEAKNYPNLYKKVDFSRIKKLVINANKATPSLSDLLGVNKTKTYLVLFQNNMELRPTGGFIGSFALVSFGSGKLNEVSVQDVYSADGQLKGHVEPPQPIKKYLNEANWFLRDSNWDPNFSASAERAEWFLDKEIDTPVDGVIAIDLNVIKDVLEAIGPIYLSDYQTQVSSDNFYEKTQGEVEKNFFPGSTKKANFITALAKEMTNLLILNKENNKTKLAKIIYDNLEARHIQIFLHNNLAKEALSNLNWDGAFNYPTCGGDCYSDLLGLVEANLGVNKSNYYIERKYNLAVNLQEGIIKKNLSVTYKNNANLAMGNGGIYKAYTRLVVPLNSDLEFIEVGNNPLQPDIETVSGRKEIGFYFELPPGQTKTINMAWQTVQPLSLNRAGRYLMYVRKQAGTPAEPIIISYNTSPLVDLSVEPGYNTLFAKDIYSKVTWKK